MASEALDSLTRATQWLIGQTGKDADAALAGASPYLRLFGITTGGCYLAQQALAAIRLGEAAQSRLALARFFAENFAVQAGGLNAPWSRRAGPDWRRCGTGVSVPKDHGLGASETHHLLARLRQCRIGADQARRAFDHGAFEPTGLNGKVLGNRASAKRDCAVSPSLIAASACCAR